MKSNSDYLDELNKVSAAMAAEYTKPVMDWILGLDSGTPLKTKKPAVLPPVHRPKSKSRPSCSCTNCLGDLI